MPVTGVSGLITRQPLSAYSVAYMQEQDAFIATQLFPFKTVTNRTFSFYQGTRDMFRHEANLDAPSGAEARASSYTWTLKNASTKEYAHKSLVLGRDVRDIDQAVGDLNQGAVENNTQKLLIDMEVKAMTKATTAANYPSALVLTLTDASNRWSDTNGDPIANIRAMKAAVFAQSGVIPNRLAVSWEGAQTLRFNAAVLARMAVGNQSRTPTMQDVADLLELDGIDVSRAMRNTANEGAAVTLGGIWTDSAVLYYRSPNAGARNVTYGATFALQTNLYTTRWDAPELGRGLGAWWIENGWEFSQEFVSTVSDTDGDSNAGALIVNIY